MKIFVRIALLLAGSLLAAPATAQVDQAPARVARTAPWPKEIVELAESLPVQDGGRVKPFLTYAGFTLLRMNGKRTVVAPSGEKLAPTEWLLDVFFFPEQANDYPIFQVDDVAAVHEIGAPTEGKQKRDRYSYNELKPAISKLLERGDAYMRIDEKLRDPVQNQVVMLAHSVFDYSQLQLQTRFTRTPIAVAAGDGLTQIFGGREQVSLSEVLGQVPALAKLQREVQADPARVAEEKALDALITDAIELTRGTDSVALYPPPGDVKEQPEWYSPSDVAQMTLGNGGTPAHLGMLADLEHATASRGDMNAFHKAFASFAGRTKELARARGEYDKVDLEVVYYKSKLLDYAHYAFVLGFLLAAFLWLRPNSKWLYRATALTAVTSVLLLIGVIVMRCMIRERPPVSTLYETVLFVTAIGTSAALVMEWINHQKLAVSAAVVLGMLGIFVANRYEELDKKDTMPQLVAVLDTNFWLATHVTAITVGYSAGMLAALLANVYLVSRLFGIRKAEPTHLKTLSRMVYGVLCFGLIFSVVGTILGGIWANDSWGRFWGWDPKENGALLICLTQIVILHLRMGGYVRDFGVAMVTAFGGTVVAFSWFGVNLLNVGLHSYGFTAGIHFWLWAYYLGQWGLIGVCGVHHLIEGAKQHAASTETRSVSVAPSSADPRTT
ncbi:MAG: cytochrome c biogenesis protein CcsA [Planctomycetes bacterium]|nr:cytochrome c biogenesis protein CcsA [Planctomycetota bacterium]